MRLRTRLLAGIAAGALLWLPMTSVGLCAALGTLQATNPWVIPIAAYYYWDYRHVPVVARSLAPAAKGAGLLALVPALCALCWPESRRLRVARPGERPPAPRRALSDLHGSADWLSIADAKRLFPGPDPIHGGVVVGEAYRVDQDKVADQAFDPDDKRTWGKGGTVPLLIDPCTSDAGHGAVISGTGGYKTTSVTISTLLHWTCSAVVLDPSCQVGPMTTAAREAMGHRVVTVGPGLDGFNVLDWIDPRDPLAETHVESIIDMLTGDAPTTTPDAKSGEFFKDRGRELLTCLLADLLWSDLPPARKTLHELRQRAIVPEKRLRGLLAEIHVASRSTLARDLAGTLKDVVADTYSGIVSTAATATRWLSVAPYAEMVSGRSFKTDQLRDGKLTVFVQIPMESLRATPALARVIVASLLGSVYRAQGDVRGRVLFLLDEVNFLGRMKAIEDARDAGRKYGITLVCLWQSLGQITDTWGQGGKASWFNSCSWRLFAAVDDPATAEEVSKTAGRFTVLARTQGISNSSQSGGQSSSRNSGRNEGQSEQARELIKPDEVRTELRADEAIIFRRGAAPLRCGRAIYFRRPEMVAQIKADRYRKETP